MSASRIRRPEEHLVRRIQDSFVETCNNDEIRTALSQFVDTIFETKLRFVPRDTAEYYKILLELNLPKYLRQPDLRGEYFRTRIDEAYRFDQKVTGFQSKKLIEDEFDQITMGDIPVFKFEAGGKYICLSNGEKISTFSMTAIDHAKAKLQGAESEDIREQCELVSSTFGYPFRLPTSSIGFRKIKQRDNLTCLLDQIAERIILEAIKPTNALARWFSVGSSPPPHGCIAGYGDPSGFKGALGICRALEAYLVQIGSTSSNVLVNKFLRQQAKHFRFVDNRSRSRISSKIIGLEGIAGNLVCVNHLLAMNQTRWERLEEYADVMLDELVESVPDVVNLDVISGLSGAVLGLTNALDIYPGNAEKICEVREHLSSRFIELCSVEIQQVSNDNQQSLFSDIGVSHGTAGALAASYLLSCDTGEHTSTSSIQKHMSSNLLKAYRHFGYWPDLREKTDRMKMNLSWCNGRVGIAKVLAMDPQNVSIYEDLVETIWTECQSETLFEQGTRFCCGASGVLDLIVDATNKVDSIPDPNEISNFTIKIAERCVKDFMCNEVSHTFESHTANLYYGKSGVLYTALRTIQPELPSLSCLSV